MRKTEEPRDLLKISQDTDLEPQRNTEATVVLTVALSSGLDGQDNRSRYQKSFYFLELELGSCELPDVSAGNQTPALWKNRKFS